MRSKFHVSRLRALSKASAFFVLTASIAACSNDVARLDSMLTASVQTTENQQSIIKSGSRQATSKAQPFPGDVNDVRKTRSGIQVAKRAVENRSSTLSSSPLAPSVARSSLPAVASSEATIAVGKPNLPKVGAPSIPSATSKSVGGPIVLQPRRAQANPLRITGTDNLVTGTTSVAASQASQNKPVQNAPVGWKNSKGTWITVNSGETLYNISRRYGVPVMAIMSANNIGDANSVEAGRKILIPTYTYSKSAPISAPDNNPVTKASRASRGFQGQARGKVAVPKNRSVQTELKKTPEPFVPVRSVSVKSGKYTVVSGDTLSKIAQLHKTTVADIKLHNGLSRNVVRLGQKLRIPGGVELARSNSDTMATGSVPKKVQKPQNKKSVYTKPADTISIAKRAEENVTTPVKTSSAKFRWPARGRLISKFGDRNSSGSNDGVDISMPVGTSVKATENGTVIYSGAELEDFGKLILLSHEGGWVSAYAHASKTLVRRGEKVRRGQIIAKSGRTGNATVPKLHFELRKNSNPVNPLKHLSR